MQITFKSGLRAVILALAGVLNLFAAETNSNVYLLAPYDKVIISVYGQDDLTSEQRISDQGAISMPLLGDVTIGGLDVFDAKKLLESKFIAERYLANPVVTVSIDEFSPKVVTVLGEVESPGSIEIPQGRNGLPIQTAIAQAGGFTGAAQKGEVLVTRNKLDDGKVVETSTTVDVAQILQSSDKSGKSRQFLVMPEDIIFVPRRLF